jgi:hypothetical protein
VGWSGKVRRATGVWICVEGAGGSEASGDVGGMRVRLGVCCEMDREMKIAMMMALTLINRLIDCIVRCPSWI